MYPLPLKILAIDPAAAGISGWAELLLTSLSPLSITIGNTGTLHGDQVYRQKKDAYPGYSRQYCIVDSLREEYIQLINLIQPHVVVSEGAFAGNNISAVISLTLAVNALRTAAHVTMGKDIIIVAPRTTKKAFTGDSMADKDIMRLAFFTHEEFVHTKDNLEISEHEIDAVAHGYAFIKRDITHEITQTSSADIRRMKKERKRLREEKLKQKENNKRERG